jgi:hypothetical protein
VTAVGRRFRNVHIVEERLLKPEILLSKGLVLPPYIHASTGTFTVNHKNSHQSECLFQKKKHVLLENFLKSNVITVVVSLSFTIF